MIRRAQPWLGTIVDISVEGTLDHEVVTTAFAEVARLHGLMSFHDGTSDISAINQAAAGDVIRVDADTWAVLDLARDMADLSSGAFDIACAPFLVERQVLPAPAQASPLPAARTSREVLALEDGGWVRKLAPGWIDVGGIAKGYVVDSVVDLLRASGVPGGCVNAGGDLRVFGSMRIPVAVRAPLSPGQAACCMMLSNAALATSGSYFSAHSHRGRPVSALLDARDGKALIAVRSASVRAGRCAAADALTKVVLATGDYEHPALAAFGATAFLI